MSPAPPVRPRTTMRPPEARPPVRRRGRTVATYAEPAARRAAPATLRAADRHLVRRFSFGLTPGLAAEVEAAGGGRRWFEKQLRPGRVADRGGDAVDGWFPSVRRTPEDIFDRNEAETEYVWEVAVDFSRWTMSRRILGKRQVHEVMTDFWSNLLNVSLFHDDAQFYRMDYDRVIREHALGSFEDLLHDAITHPAMGLYLDNAFSTKQAPNENLGRELLELHTVGVDAGYTEADVKASARMLTGYRVDVWWPRFRAFYDTRAHDTRPVQVMGFHHDNAAADGRDATRAYLSYLARHPATAQRLARRLCAKFVSDTPSPSIVSAVASAYVAHGTAIKPTLRAMVDHPDFGVAPLAKVRMPSEDYVATVRALGIKPQRPTGDQSFANAMYWQYVEAGQPPYEWPAPNGYPEVGGAWASAGRVLTAFEVHRDLAARWWPTEQASFPDQADLLPTMPATLQEVVDHLGRRVLGQRPPAEAARGIARLLGRGLGDRLTRGEALDYWTFRGIVSSLLDSPTHLHR